MSTFKMFLIIFFGAVTFNFIVDIIMEALK